MNKKSTAEGAIDVRGKDTLSDLFLRPLFTWRSIVASSFGPGQPTTRHVLLTLALYMSEKGDSCWPSNETIAEASGLGLTTVKEHLKIAAQDGWIGKRDRRMRNSQGWRRVEYFAQIPPDAEAAFHAEQRGAPAVPPEDSAAAVPPQGGAVEATTWCASPPNVVRQPHLNTSKNSTRTPRRELAPRPGVHYEPSEAVKAWAREEGYEPYLPLHVTYFRNQCANQRRSAYRDLDAAFRNCVLGDYGSVRFQAKADERRAGAVAHGTAKWWVSDESKRAKAAELGITMRAGETWPELTERINAEIARRRRGGLPDAGSGEARA